MSADRWITLTWMDDHAETHYGHVRLLDSAGGIIQVIVTRQYGPDDVVVSVPTANLRHWTSSDYRPEST